MAPYVYQRLQKPDNTVGEFRLVTLHHGAFLDDIKVSIEIHRLPSTDQTQQATSPEGVSWQALSYTWGDLNDVEDVSVIQSGSGNPAGELSVTRNLAEALRNLRHNDLERLMWIDALCINQGNDELALKERAWQVRYMHHIYNLADGVVIWLGPEAQDTDFALQFLDELGGSFTIDWWTYDITTDEGKPSKQMEMLHDSTPASREHRALQVILDRPYFDRVWVKQEATLANESGSLVVVGHRAISLNNFRKAIVWSSRFGLHIGSVNAARELARFTGALNICVREYINEPELMRKTRPSVCRDPRDKVYGNLGIMALSGFADVATQITIDYSDDNTVEKTYLNFFVQYHKRYNSLRLLMDSGLSQGSNMRPTWVPDWRNEQRAQLDLTMESATSHFLAAECQYRDGDLLQVVGKHATEISHVRVLESVTDWHANNEWFEELALLMKDHIHPLHMGQGVEMVTRAVAAYLYNPSFTMEIIQRAYAIFKPYFKVLYNIVTNANWRLRDSVPPPRKHMDEDTAVMLEQCIRWFKMERAPLIFSADGHIGVGPLGVEIGDEIYAILGCRSLIVLRPSKGKGSHLVVGPSFVHGLNWGEALLGPLPDGCTVIPRFQPSRSGYVPQYVNNKANTESMWDPRIAWSELEAHPPMVNFVPIQAPPGEPFRLRPDSEYLRRHGVELETLMLE